jgi:hypothetical protein
VAEDFRESSLVFDNRREADAFFFEDNLDLQDDLFV